MKKAFSKIISAAVMLYTGTNPFNTKASDNYPRDASWSMARSLYWVEVPVSRIPDPEPSLLSSISTTIVKWIEFVLVALVFVIWIISYFKIRKIDDKKLRAKKIKKTIIIIAIIVIIGILVTLWDRMYESNMFDNLLGK